MGLLLGVSGFNFCVSLFVFLLNATLERSWQFKVIMLTAQQ